MTISQGTVCKLCKHVYIFPCHGERYDCANAVHVRSKGKIDLYKLPIEEQNKIAKTGKLPDPSKFKTAEPVKVKRARVRLEELAVTKRKRVKA